jgi:hypothetical protein
MTARFALLLALTVQFSHAAAQQVITTPPPATPPMMVCVGALSQATNMAWDSSRVEFSFPYVRQQQSVTLKANIAQLSAPLLVDSDEAFMRGRETKARPISADDRAIAITELRISRSTGAFSMVVLQFRNVDVLEGRSLWEGDCSVQGSRRF